MTSSTYQGAEFVGTGFEVEEATSVSIVCVLHKTGVAVATVTIT